MWGYIQLAVLNKVHLNTCLQNIFSTLQTTLAVQQKHFSFVCMSVLRVKNVPILTLIQAKLDNVRGIWNQCRDHRVFNKTPNVS